MIQLVLIFNLLTASSAHAGTVTCKSSLSDVLQEAKQAVKSKYSDSDPCSKGALNGVKHGTGCSVMSLKLTLAKYYYRAQSICKSTCKSENKQAACEALISTERMLANGINGLRGGVSSIVYHREDDVRFEDYNSYEEWLEAFIEAQQGTNEPVEVAI